METVPKTDSALLHLEECMGQSDKHISIPYLKYLRFFLCGIIVGIGSLLTIFRALFTPFHPKNVAFFNRFFTPIIFKILGVTMEIEGKQNLKPGTPAIFIGNHQSNLDMFILGRMCVQGGVSVGKDIIKWIPLFGQAYWLAGNILIKRKNKVKSKESMIECRKAILNKGTSIFMLPEGTRNHGKGLAPFKTGSFRLAIDTRVPLVPISVNTYCKNGLNFNLWNSVHVKVLVHDPISTKELSHKDMPELIEKSWKTIQEGIVTMDNN